MTFVYAALAYVLLVAGIAVGLDELVWRPAHRRHRLLDEDGLAIVPDLPPAEPGHPREPAA